QLGTYGSNSTDIGSVVNGTTAFGALIRGMHQGHLVLALRDNDATDSVSIISGGGNDTSDQTYDTLVAQFLANGNARIGGTLSWGGDDPIASSDDVATIGSLAAVAFSGDYDDLSNTPTIPPDVSAATFITASDETSTLSNSRQLVAGANITLDTSTPGQIVISSSASGGGGGQVDEVIGTAGQIDVDNSDPAKPVLSLHSNVLAALGLAGTAVQPGDLADVAFSGDYGDLTNVPSTFPPAAHTDRTSTRLNSSH